MNYVPFVYLLRFKPTGQLYIGAHFANRKGCIAHPDELWKTYFTSSDKVKEKIKEFGKDSFEYEVRKTFTTREEALKYENRFLVKVDAARNPKFLNRSNGGGKFVGGPHSDSTKVKLRKAWKTRPPISSASRSQATQKLTGKKKSPEHATNIAKATTEVWQNRTQEQKEEIGRKISAVKANNKLLRQAQSSATTHAVIFY